MAQGRVPSPTSKFLQSIKSYVITNHKLSFLTHDINVLHKLFLILTHSFTDLIFV